MKKLLHGDELEKRARELGIDTQGGPIIQSNSGRHKRADDAELQRRVIEAERSIRESGLWKFAFISAIASVCAAIAAVIAAVIAVAK
ncbi:MAG: hypothetical protein AB1646_15735 [Thermodesulfobacteriota bacterium]